MGYQVTLAPSARGDLREIARYIATDDPAQATAFVRRMVDSTRRLADFPELGRVVPGFHDPPLREIVVRSYRVDHPRRLVEVARFWHGARGIPEIGLS